MSMAGWSASTITTTVEDHDDLLKMDGDKPLDVTPQKRCLPAD